MYNLTACQRKYKISLRSEKVIPNYATFHDFDLDIQWELIWWTLKNIRRGAQLHFCQNRKNKRNSSADVLFVPIPIWDFELKCLAHCHGEARFLHSTSYIIDCRLTLFAELCLLNPSADVEKRFPMLPSRDVSRKGGKARSIDGQRSSVWRDVLWRSAVHQ